MNINGKKWRTIWLEANGTSIGVIDQRKLPHRLTSFIINSHEEAATAIKSMIVRGAPLIGVTGAYAVMLAMQKDPSNESLDNAYEKLLSTRPTAVNLSWALQRMNKIIKNIPLNQRAEVAKKEAQLIAEEDVLTCEAIGSHGVKVIKEVANSKNKVEVKRAINILTHCNAGWLAAVDWGTALAPIYKGHRSGMDIHVWVDETRPRNQGASLTAYELGCEGVPHTVIVDNAGGHLMQHGQVDLVIVGSDRTTSSGDVCNKIGTYLKALAAYDNSVPFYVALPSSTIDWSISDGIDEIPIENRSPSEIFEVEGQLASGEIKKLRLCPVETKGYNPAFDVTPRKLITGLITEKGIFTPNELAMQSHL
tara:strand:+ start:456 stop:1547 length:1092 start_codon:yes stop_codon:yes gene_type:complete